MLRSYKKGCLVISNFRAVKPSDITTSELGSDEITNHPKEPKGYPKEHKGCSKNHKIM